MANDWKQFPARPALAAGRAEILIDDHVYHFDGGVIYGKAEDLPDAEKAHAVLPFPFYFAMDTGALYRNDGEAWHGGEEEEEEGGGE